MTSNALTESAEDAAAAKPRRSISFTARDLLNVAIFVAIYVAIVIAIAMIGIISPLMMLITRPLAPIAAGIPYMLFLTRVRHGGMVTLFGVVLALLYLMIGQPWHSTVATIVASVLADLVLWVGKYRSKWAAIWTYVVFSAWFIGPWIPFALDPDAYLQTYIVEQMGGEYVRDFERVVTLPAVGIVVAATMVCGLIGALLGTGLLRKHFRKAGLA